MYFPVGWPKQLQVNGCSVLVHIAASQSRLLFAVLTEDSVTIWNTKPAVQIVAFQRSRNSVSEFGANQVAQWKLDSTMLAVTTDKGYIIFFKVEVDARNGQAELYQQREERKSGNRTEIVELEEEASIVSLKLLQASYIQVPGGVTSLVCLRDELMVATTLGHLQRIKWDGYISEDMTILLAALPFSVDLQHSRALPLGDSDVYIKTFEYHPLLGGFAAVLSNGKGAFVTANTLKFDPSNVVGVWAQETTAATSVAINPKYALMAFGCGNGEGIVYHLDEVTGALQISHKLVLSGKDSPDTSSVCGCVTELKWTPDGCALAMTWKNGGFALWSVFGSLLLHSVGAESVSSISEEPVSNPKLHIKAMEWGCEGYHLWVVSDPSPVDADYSKASGEDADRPAHLLQLQFVKSALAVNPCMANHEHLFLQGEDKLYVNPDDSMPQVAQPSATQDAGLVHPSSLLGSKQWQIVPMPHTYLIHNWPIRFAAISVTGHCVAIAGKSGLAHYALFSRKWKLFGNETQERDMIVTGGLTWWKDFICTACYNLLNQRDEIRFYPRDCKLDNTFCQVVRVPSQIMLLNTFRDILIVLCVDCHIMLYKLERKNSHPNPQVLSTKVQEVAIGSFIPHPANVVALTLTSIRTETASVKIPPQANEAESIILNVAGRLLMFQRDRSGTQVKVTENKDRPLPFCAPVIVASSVENVWLCNHKNEQKPHLTEALWLGCGAAGMKVWLPLHQKDEDSKARTFMSRRIMLPFYVDIYPLALLFESGLILGALSECTSYQSSCAIGDGWPYLQLERTSQVYLPHILRQLLRRNLGVHALEIAHSCTNLSYFSHVLELLLHLVLEEEATSKEPIPDPLLPRVVAFVQEFPEYLQTVVHCARKTEVALWQYLFATVGNPKDLFEECLMSGELKTAGSYLIILQNLEKPVVARQHATLLLDASLEKCEWDLARELVRFLRAIDPTEAESPLASKPRKTSTVYPTTFPHSPPISDSDSFRYPAPVRARSLSATKEEVGKDSSKAKEKVKVTKSDTQTNRRRSPSGSSKEESTAEQFFIDVILSRHARKLLQVYRVHDLACFAANLDDYQLVGWLRKERIRAARVEDFVMALKKTHKDFSWPMPILSLSSLRKIASAGSLTSPLSVDINGDTTNPLIPLAGVSASAKPGETSSAQSPSQSESSTADVLLQPQLGRLSLDMGGSQATNEQSDNSSALGDVDSADSSGWADSLCLSELEQLSQELANKGPPQSDVELRYLLHILLEAGCLEWALVISVVLRDAMAVVRTVNTASMTDTPIEMIGRMREGLSYLDLWAETECIGYKPFLQAIQGQTKLLQSLIEQNLPSSRMPMPVKTHRLSTSSTESMGSVDGITHSQSMERDIADGGPEDGQEDGSQAEAGSEQGGYECAVS